jgi:restriction system protein
LRVLGGSASRSEIREELKNSSKVVSPEEISAQKQSKKNPGQTFRPFDFNFYMAIKNLVFAGFLREMPKSSVELTAKGRTTDTNSWDLDRDVYSLSRPEWDSRAKKNKERRATDKLSTSRVDMKSDGLGTDEDEEIDTDELAEIDPSALFQKQLNEALMKLSPAKFELFSRKLLSQMGATLDDEKGVKLTGDEGLDGFGYMRSNDFRTTRVAVQAKRWSRPVPSPEIDRFKGAMVKSDAEYGVFITTSDFTKAAVEAARKGRLVVTLINGDEIARLMTKYEFYVTPVVTYKLDDFFFEEE